MKTRSKYILFVFVSIIVLLLGGIFFTAAQQENEGPITAEAAENWYWGDPTSCPKCGADWDFMGNDYTITKISECQYRYVHTYQGSTQCSGTITIHAGVTVAEVKPTCTTAGNTAGTKCGICGFADPYNMARPLAALGHDYEATWTWSGYESATARLKCSRCASSATYTAEISETVSAEATCTVQGLRIYTATVSHNGKDYTNSKFETISPLGHDWEEEWTTDATMHWHACSRCDAKKEINLGMPEDQLKHSAGSAATCTEDQVCTVCGRVLKEALGHSEGAPVRENEVPASCFEAGSYDEAVYCSVCNEELSREQKAIDALGHDWSEEWTTDGTSHWHECSRCDEINDKANHSGGTATCNALAKCSVCGKEYGSYGSHSYTRSDVESTLSYCSDTKYTCRYCSSYYYSSTGTTSRTRHSLTSRVETAATCTTSGTRRYTCTDCGYTYTTTISALGHDWSDEWTTDGASHWHECSRCDEINDKANHSGGTATCNALAKCSVCGKSYGSYGSHSYVASSVASTSTYCSDTKYTCRYCSSYYYSSTKTTSRSRHSFTSYIETTATCTTAGTRRYTCTDCDYTYTTTISALGHDLERHDGQPATCTEIGWNDYETCSRAGCGYTTYREIAATGHTPGATATCTTPQTCTTCGAELVAALGHKTVSHLGQDPTCTEEGWEPYETCENCDYTTYEAIDPLGHDWAEEWTMNDTAHWHKCSRCDEINNKANHSGGGATCIALAKCEVCGVEYGNFAEHVYVENAEERYLVSAATCTASATYYKSCSVCGEAGEEIFEYGDPLGHEYGEPEWTWNGYTSATATFTCTRNGCGDKQTVTASSGSITSVVTTPAECEKEGLRTYTAKVAFKGEEYTDATTEVIDALGHSFTNYISDNNATCTENGTETAKCDRCDATDTRTDVDSALGHDWATEWTTDGTSHWHECSRCDEINDKANHSGGAATCTKPAECEVCGVEYGDALGHTEGEAVRENEVPASCTETGSYDEVVYCSVCGDELSREEKVIDALGHSFTNYISDNNATCTENGTETAKCDRCDATDTRTDEDSALGHDWSEEWTTDGTSHWHECSRCDEINDKANHSGGAATCTKPAECEVCGVEYGDALGHTEGEAVRENEIPANCTEAGSYDEVIYCSVCGEELSREQKVIDALGHDLEHHEAKPATCTEIGWNAYDTCSRCDYTTYVEIEALGHTEGEAVRENEVPASCTEVGSYDEVVYCSVCGEELSREEKVIDALGHDLEHHEAKPATCTEIGWNAYDTCSRCDYTTYVEIPAKGHTEGEPVRENEVDASCTETGSYDEVVYCSVCGEELSREEKVIDALGHDLEHHEAKPATCTEIGWNAYDTCTRCDYTTYVEIEALGHTEGEAVRENKIPANCTEAGSYDEVIYCSVCGEELSREQKVIDALGHDLEHHEAKPATCTEIGWNAYDTCSRCDYTTYVEIEALGHTEGEAVRENEVPASCTEAGSYDEVVYCSVCGEELSREEKVIDALGHDLEHHEAKPATCTEIGWNAYDTCSRCDYTTYVEIDALGHTEGEAVRENEVPASCTEVGSYDEVVYCSVCGEELSREEKVIDALGHSFTNYISDNNATCTENGTETAKCDRCDATDTRTDVDSALGHDWSDEWTTDGTSHWHECSRCDEINDKANHSGGAATCTKPAECEVCGIEYGDALGHDLEHHAAKDASCTEIGWAAYDACTRCDYTTYKEIPAKGHTFGPDATCTEDQVCLECGEVISAASGHIPGPDATCTENQTCSVCGEILTPALGHSFTNYISDNNATCTENGTETAKCDRCDATDTRTDEDSALGHDWAEEWTTDGTSHWHECSRCDEINDKANHSGGTATCIALAKCEICGVEYGDFAEHVYVESAEEQYLVSAATCTASATYFKSCSVCGEAGEEIFEYGDPLGHEYGEPEWTWAGYTSATATFTCTRNGCGDKQTATASGSSITSAVTTPAECEKEGLKTYTAKVTFGGEEYTDTTTEKLDALGHTEGETVRENEVPASCTEAGSYDEVVYCSVCGDELSREEKVIDALGHSFTNYISDNNATCTENGTETAKCDRCDATDTRTDEDSALGHDWSEEWTTDGTSHWHECSRCDEINDEANHSGGAATCTKPAECEVCGVEYGDALGHTEGEAVRENEVDASCTEAGSYDEVVYCSVCGEELSRAQKVIPAKGHTFGPDATCTEDQICTVCGEIISAASGHIPGPEATCTLDQTCSICGEILTPALGHDWATEWTTDGTSHWHECSRCDEINDKASHSGGAATCTKPAECEVCGVEYGDALGHTEGEPVRENVVDASCIEAGSYDEVIYCSVCGEELSREEKVIDALGHDLEHHEAKPATCTEIGWNAYDTCTRCDYTTYEEIEALGHTEGEPVRENEIPASCTEAGSYDEVVYCSVCSEELSREEKVIDALGHDLEHHEAKPATCTEIGWNAYDTCSRCDYSTYREIAATGHTPGAAATCTEDQICTTCGETLVAALGHDFRNGYCVRCGVAEDIAFENEKEDTKSDLDEIGQEIKDEIDASDLPDDVKEDLKDKVDEIVNDAKTETDEALDYEDLDDIKQNAQQEIEDAVLEAEKADAMTDLDEIAQDAKDEIDASDLPDDVKGNLKDKVDEIIGGAKDEVGGVSTKEELDQVIEDAKSEIEDAIQNAEKDDAAADLDEIAQDAKDEIDASDLPDDVKEDLKDKVDEIVDGAKDEVNGELTKEEVEQTIEDAKSEIEDAVLEAEKADAMTDLDEIAQDAKDEIDASDLPDDVKENLKDKVDEIVNDAKTEIDGEASKDEVEQTIEDAKSEIEDAVLEAEKADAMTDLDEIAQDAKDKIDASDLPDDVKEDLKDKVDEIIGGAKDEVDGVSTKEELDQVIEDTKSEIEDAIQNAEKNDAEGDLTEEKDAAVSELESAAQEAKDKIDGSDLNDEEKAELKGEIDKIISEAKETLNASATLEEIEGAVNSAMNEIAEVTEGLETEKGDTRLLWPWLVITAAISAGLSALFAWRHVKKVRAKGGTVGARSIVTIAVATILIFVVVIGIALLIFAMV